MRRKIAKTIIFAAVLSLLFSVSVVAGSYDYGNISITCTLKGKISNGVMGKKADAEAQTNGAQYVDKKYQNYVAAYIRRAGGLSLKSGSVYKKGSAAKSKIEVRTSEASYAQSYHAVCKNKVMLEKTTKQIQLKKNY